jgi:hypothetical protein
VEATLRQWLGFALLSVVVVGACVTVAGILVRALLTASCGC